MKRFSLPAFALWALRITLATAFLSAVADRFGWWGSPGAAGVSWGDWQNFLGYNAKVLDFLPRGVADVAGTIATAAETALAIWLLTGWKTRIAGFGSAGLLLLFALSMALSFGVKAPLNYSVFTGAAAALALATFAPEKER